MKKCINCKTYEAVIEELCHDNAFGILTRNGLEYKLKQIDDITNYRLIWLDFCNVSKSNMLLGYEEVNRRFRELFKQFGSADEIIGRCFSGDEIIVITKNTDCLVGMKTKANLLGLDFRYCIGDFTGNLEKDLNEIREDIFGLATVR